MVEISVHFRIHHVGHTDNAERTVNHTGADTYLQQDETGFNGRNIRLELLRRSNHIFIGNKHVFKIQAVSARTFQTAKLRAILQGHAFPLAAGNKHHIAVADLGGIRPNMVFADIGYPRQRAVDFVAALDALGL